MKHLVRKLLAAAFCLVFLTSALLCAQAGNRNLKSGRLLSTEITAYGANDKGKGSRADLWWTYCICAEDRTYFAVSRENPAKAGLTVNSELKFTATSDRMTVVDSKGKQHVMRITRQDKEKTCR